MLTFLHVIPNRISGGCKAYCITKSLGCSHPVPQCMRGILCKGPCLDLRKKKETIYYCQNLFFSVCIYNSGIIIHNKLHWLNTRTSPKLPGYIWKMIPGREVKWKLRNINDTFTFTYEEKRASLNSKANHYNNSRFGQCEVYFCVFVRQVLHWCFELQVSRKTLYSIKWRKRGDYRYQRRVMLE